MYYPADARMQVEGVAWWSEGAVQMTGRVRVRCETVTPCGAETRSPIFDAA